MAMDPSMRASNADRERVAQQLSDHFAEGRLTSDEFHERLDSAYAAKTLGDLAALTKDLPATSAAAPAPAIPSTPADPRADYRRYRRDARIDHRAGGHLDRHGARAALASWAFVSSICVVIWLAAGISGGSWGDFWPIWVIGPWGVIVLSRVIGGYRR